MSSRLSEKMIFDLLNRNLDWHSSCRKWPHSTFGGLFRLFGWYCSNRSNSICFFHHMNIEIEFRSSILPFPSRSCCRIRLKLVQVDHQ
jgi:hypothetical protein